MEGLLSYSETCIQYALTPEGTVIYELVADTGFGSSAVGKQVLKQIEKVQTVTRVPLKYKWIIHGIGGLSRSKELVQFNVFLKAKSNGTIKMPINAFLLEEIGTDVLLGNDVIIAYQIVLDNSKQQITLPGKDSANIIIDSIIHEKKQVKLLPVWTKDTYKIPASSHQTIAICLLKSLLPGQDYAFSSKREGVPNGYLGADVETILFSNPTQEMIMLKKGTTIGTVASISRAEAESTKVWNEATDEIKSFFSIHQSPRPEGKPIASDITVPLNEEYHLSYQFPPPEGIAIPNTETSTYSNVNINPDLSGDQIDMLARLVRRHRTLFNDSPGIAHEPRDEWLQIPVDPKDELAYKTPPLFCNSPRDCTEINKVFDVNWSTGRMGEVPISKGSPYALQVFVARQNGKP